MSVIHVLAHREPAAPDGDPLEIGDLDVEFGRQPEEHVRSVEGWQDSLLTAETEQGGSVSGRLAGVSPDCRDRTRRNC